MKRDRRQIVWLMAISAVFGVGVWALLRFTPLRRQATSAELANAAALRNADPELWAHSIEKVKEDRPAAENVAIEIPAELRHYEDRHWFLATQVAEVRKFNVQAVQDYVDLAAMIKRGDLVPVPAVTDTYILYGVGAKADNGAFTRWVDDRNVELYDDGQLRDAYARLETARANLQTEIASLQKQAGALKKGQRAKEKELQSQLAARQKELKANEDNKALLDQSYGSPEGRQKLLNDYESLQTIAKSFGGRSFNLNDADDRQALKLYMLSSLRPQALKTLEEVAKAYNEKFARPLPVSSLLRPEQYQHTLRRFNRNATLIDTPPHSTGLAFDIDYRFMSGAEQNFLMNELARLKNAGRIEVLRERNANYHVFTFIDGQRPSDDLITAALDEVGGPAKDDKETDDAEKSTAKTAPSKKAAAKAAPKSRAAKNNKTQSKPKTAASKSKPRKRR